MKKYQPKPHAKKAKTSRSASKMKREERRKAWVRNTSFILAVVLTVIYLGWRMLYTLPLDDGVPQVIFGILLITAETLTSFTTFELYYRKFKSDHAVLDFPEVDERLYPHVDVFIATHNEDLDILYKTANACTFMDYPDKSKVHIYFCDDGNRPQVAELAKELGIGYLGFANNKHAKSGNLNNAFDKTTSPLIATFDADMIPQHTFLMKTVPYFFLPEYIKDKKTGVWRKRTDEEKKDPRCKIGLIQTPQSFYNPDLFQFNLYSENNIPNEQDFFSREINIMRNSSNSCSYTGSNTLISRQAMVDIGKFPYNTITEDFEVSIRMQKKKYITYATTEVQAAGLTTTDFKSMLKQRKRWGRGIIQSLQNTNAIFSRELTMGGRMTYLTSYLYWWSFFHRIVFILAPILFALFDFRVVDCTFQELLVFWLPSYFFYSTSFRFLSSNVRTNRWSQTIDTIFAPYLVGCILLETFGIHERKFKVTKKGGAESFDLRYALPHFVLIALSILALIRFMWGKYGWALVYSSIIIFWLFYNLISLIYAVFFMLGRKAVRKSERIKANEAVEITCGNIRTSATTVDLSDEGMAFYSDRPIFIPDGEQVKVVIHSERYTSDLKGQIVYVKQTDEGWFYAMTVVPVDGPNKRQYFQLIYDRSHSLPLTVDKWSTISDDIKRNLYHRLHKPMQQRRKQARADIEAVVQFDGGGLAFAHDFNYKYLSLSDTNASVYYFTLINGAVLKFVETEQKIEKFNATLYELENLSELMEAGVDFITILDELTA